MRPGADAYSGAAHRGGRGADANRDTGAAHRHPCAPNGYADANEHAHADPNRDAHPHPNADSGTIPDPQGVPVGHVV